jgi:hypothetical protein
MKKIILISVIILTISCSKKIDEEQNGVVVSVDVDFHILNQNGDDLLNPATAGYLHVENMKLYYLINGERIEVYDTLMQYPRNIGLNTESTPYSLGIGTYEGEYGLISEVDGVKTGIAIALLEFSEGITDTIKTEWESKETKCRYFVNRKVWYNGELHSPDSVFEVRK